MVDRRAGKDMSERAARKTGSKSAKSSGEGAGAARTTRDRILDAASRIVARHGVAAATTKRIAADARLSEGSLYNHFRDKPDLLIALVLERLPNIKVIFQDLHDESVPLAKRLVAAVAALIEFYRATQPLISGIVSDPDLLKLCRKRFIESGQGPHLAHEKLTAVLRAAQSQGLVRAESRPEMLAALLIAACTEYASLNAMTGKSPADLDDKDYAAAVVQALAPAIFPQRP
jgi:AcrR family transcriptional regulator